MNLGVYVSIESFTVEAYEESLVILEQAGHSPPKGRVYHCAMKTDTGIDVFDVWDADADLQPFRETLMPIIAKAGGKMGQARVGPVVNTSQ